jgi:hypothetical protein
MERDMQRLKCKERGYIVNELYGICFRPILLRSTYINDQELFFAEATNWA